MSRLNRMETQGCARQFHVGWMPASCGSGEQVGRLCFCGGRGVDGGAPILIYYAPVSTCGEIGTHARFRF